MKIQATTKDAYQLFHKGILAIGEAERQGMRIDVDYCQSQKEKLTKKVARIEQQLSKTDFIKKWKKTAGSNLNIYANDQLGKYLYEVLSIKPVKLTPTDKGSVDEEALTQLDVPELNMILKSRKLMKIRDTYLEAFVREQVDGILHPFFNLHLARTFRSSSDSPNFQNIPIRDEVAMKMCRGAIRPRPGYQLGEIDYSNLEVNVGECYHLDPNMMKYLLNKNSDMHRDMAKHIFFLKDFNKKIKSHGLLRRAAKGGFTFPQFYGDYYVNCALNLATTLCGLPAKGQWKSGQGIIQMPEFKSGATIADWMKMNGIQNLKQFEKHIKKIEEDFWGRRFKVYDKWRQKQWARYQRKGYLDMLTGFRCSGMMDRKQVSNTPIQGSAFHCLLWAFIEITETARREGWRTKIIGQIHDSILLDIWPVELDHVLKTCQYIMCEALKEAWEWITVPLSIGVELCNVDEPWSEKKEMEIVA